MYNSRRTTTVGNRKGELLTDDQKSLKFVLEIITYPRCQPCWRHEFKALKNSLNSKTFNYDNVVK